MGFLSKFEGKMEDTVEGAAEKLGGASISPVQIAKKAEKQMRRGKVVGAGKQFAPTLYTVLVCPEDDERMFNYYPTMAGETETFLLAKASEMGLAMDGHPLVRFIADDQLKRGKFDVVAELVASQIIERLRADEMARYGIAAPARGARMQGGASAASSRQAGAGAGVVAGAAAGRAARFGAAGASRLAPRGQASPLRSAAPAQGGTFVPLAPDDDGYSQDIYDSQDFDVRDVEYGYDPSEYDPEYDEIHSANIAEPDYAPAPVPQPEQPMANRKPTPPPPEGTPREVYLYDEARDCAYQLTGSPERMGRESSNSIIIPDINASRVHAEIRCEPTGAWVITDLGSLNGVFVNGRRIKSAPLRDADMIRIGTTELEFQDLEQ